MTIRPCQEGDLPTIVDLYARRLINSTFAQLGPRFLRALLAGMLVSPHAVVLVDEDDGAVAGFIAGADDTEALFGWLKRRRTASLLVAALAGVARRPWLIPELARSARYFNESGAPEVKAEMLYIAVTPDRVGAKRSSALVAAMLTALRDRGASAVKVTCEADNLEPQHLLRAFGFTQQHSFSFYGKPMVLFVQPDLAGARLDG